MRIIHDYYNRNDPSTIYLATPNKDILCALNSIDATSVDFVGKCNDLSTLTFTINRYTENSKGESEGFSDKELNEIYHIINQTTYTNENIFTTSLDNLSENVDIQQKLCETALEDIAVYSLPQTIYSTTLDNILSAAGNELHANDLNYGNFIRVGIRDDYYVKLRVMAISFNSKTKTVS